MAKRRILTAKRLREVLYYNPTTGEFKWAKRTKNRWRDKVGTVQTLSTGYKRLMIVVDYRQYRAGRLAWLYMTGRWPEGEVDHINQDSLDNRWCNLRDASRSQNGRNHKIYKNNTSGTNGVIWDKFTGKWMVSLYGKHFGRYSAKSEARRFALSLARKN